MEWHGHIKGYSKGGEIGKWVDNDRGTEKQGEKERGHKGRMRSVVGLF